jgi:hypothetical protein
MRTHGSESSGTNARAIVRTEAEEEELKVLRASHLALSSCLPFSTVSTPRMTTNIYAQQNAAIVVRTFTDLA